VTAFDLLVSIRCNTQPFRGGTTLLQFHSHPKTLLWSTLWVALLCALPVGCQRRGYTDLYVDSMATEVRDLQDQLYEYDHEYRLLEQELESLRRANNNVRSSPSGGGPAALRNASPLEFLPGDSLPVPNRTLGNARNDLPAKNEGPQQPTLPSIVTEPEGLRSTPRVAPEEVQPAPAGAPDIRPEKKADPSTDFDFDADEIMIPSINTGAIRPPPIAPRNLATQPEQDLEVGLSQIELPLQLASSPFSGSGAKITEAAEVVKDRRVVELAFHPILCRSVNFDDDEHDDGVFLVLQPRNRAGQFVPSPASLAIEIIDPGRDNETSRIGQWTYSATEVASKIHPIGSQQGIHLTLPWNGPNPKADRITVRATYTYENGRQIAASKEFFISGPGMLKTVWAPRAGGHEQSEMTSKPRKEVPIPGNRHTAVVTASGWEANSSNRSRAVATGQFPPPAVAPAPQ